MKLMQIAAGLLVACLLLCVCNPVLAEETERIDSSSLPEPQNTYRESEAFHVYYRQISDLQKAEDTILLTLEEGEKTIEAEEEIAFTFDVPADGVYYLSLGYRITSDSPTPSIKLAVDGQVPYRELEEYALSGVYQDGEKRYNSQNDQLISKQELVPLLQEKELINPGVMTDCPLAIYLTAGSHQITVKAVNNSFVFSYLILGPETKIIDDKTYLSEIQKENVPKYQGEPMMIEAEEPTFKSDPALYALYDRNSAATTPYHPTRIRRNTIGGSSWSKYGQSLTYLVEVEEAGVYYLSLKYRQGESVDVICSRNVYVNGEIQSESFENVAFEPDVRWRWQTIKGKDGLALPLLLQAGENFITLEVGHGEFTEVLSLVSQALSNLNDLYIRIVMVTGTLPDSNRDYRLEAEIPGLLDTFKKEAAELSSAADLLDALSGKVSSASEDIRSMCRRLEEFCEKPSQIPWRLTDYRNAISGLTTWVSNMKSQPLELDCLMLHSEDAALPRANADFFTQLVHEFGIFFASFYEDYSGDTSGEGDELRVWVNMGRDQIQVIRDLVTDSFTPETEIPVYLSVVQTGLVEATLAGRNPDVALGVARGQPVNLAVRGALLSYSDYEGFPEMESRFAPSAVLPYTFENKVYGVPCSQSFFVMFYRKDILAKLGVQVPQTWKELLDVVPKLQRSHMNIGLPYAVISAAAAVDNGLGAKDIFATLLLQEGGTFYQKDGTKTALDSEAAMTAFDTWCRFYTRYGFDLIYDFYTRFTTGEMPIGITSFEMIQTLNIAAEDIRGQWEIAPIPGTKREDGSINRSEAGSGTAAVIFASTDDPQEAYTFVEWWTRDRTQTVFCASAERLLGPGGRYSTANLNAFDTLSWTKGQKEVLREQRQFVQELEEIPGSYYVTRSVDNAFRSVIYDGENPRERFEEENENINREIIRKRKELGLFVPKD